MVTKMCWPWKHNFVEIKRREIIAKYNPLLQESPIYGNYGTEIVYKCKNCLKIKKIEI